MILHHNWHLNYFSYLLQVDCKLYDSNLIQLLLLVTLPSLSVHEISDDAVQYYWGAHNIYILKAVFNHDNVVNQSFSVRHDRQGEGIRSGRVGDSLKGTAENTIEIRWALQKVIPTSWKLKLIYIMWLLISGFPNPTLHMTTRHHNILTSILKQQDCESNHICVCTILSVCLLQWHCLRASPTVLSLIEFCIDLRRCLE